MTATEALIMAEHLLTLDKYKIAALLIELEHKAHVAGINDLAESLRKGDEGDKPDAV